MNIICKFTRKIRFKYNTKLFCGKISGLNITNLPIYERFVRLNNFHGMALVSCELDELKREMKTSFGDWCLIRKFIIESRGNNLLPHSNSNTVQNSLHTTTEMCDTEINFDSVSESSKGNTVDINQLNLPSPSFNLRKNDNLLTANSSPTSNSAGRRKKKLTILKDEDRTAYNEAFKDYLRLQETEKQTSHLVVDISEKSELLSTSENLSYDDSFNGNI